MGRSAAFGPIMNLWVLLYNGGPLCGPFQIFRKHPEFGEFTSFTYLENLNSNLVTFIGFDPPLFHETY